ncbi:PH domain-containing protein [Actinosynnema sp. NPDC020468]|uniref:PH domain-containing protein n=1 Tax=Actinosynnema sp. NPDC020468 TaxID=3154488 RepID=UPI0033F54D5A
MSTPPAPAFTAEHLGRWRAAAVGWASRVVLVVGWFVAFGYTVLTEATCTVAEPCLPDPLVSVLVAAGLATPWLLWREPVLGCVAGVVFGLVVALSDDGDGVRLAFGLHGLACLVVGWRLLDGRRAQAAVFAAVARRIRVHRAATTRWTWRSPAAVVLLVLAALAVVRYGQATAALTAHQRSATTIAARVEQVDDVEVVLDLGAVDRHFPVLDPGDYQPGDLVPVRVDGDWAELAAEPEDVTYWLTFVAAATALALLLLARDGTARRRVRRVLAEPVPGVAVLVRPDRWNRAVLHTVDGRPFAVLPVTVLGDLEDESVEAVAVGELSVGGWVVLVTEDAVLVPGRPLKEFRGELPVPVEPVEPEELHHVALEVPPLPVPLEPADREVLTSRVTYAAAIGLVVLVAAFPPWRESVPLLCAAFGAAVLGWLRGRPSTVFHADHVTIRSWVRTYRVPWSLVRSVRRDGEQLVLEVEPDSWFLLAPFRRDVAEVGALARRLRELAPAGGRVTTRLGAAWLVAAAALLIAAGWLWF